MSEPLPKKTSQYVLHQNKGFEDLKLEHGVDIPEVDDYGCLVKVEAVSLNHRDLVIVNGKYPFPCHFPRIPGSDASAIVLATGAKVTQFKVGDRVCTQFRPTHQAGRIKAADLWVGLGGQIDGTSRQYAVFPETWLVKAPANLSAEEASTLTCAWVTAWNALFGLQDRCLKLGDYVLTQGTGGVSIAIVQLAVAAGAIVVATTSSDKKAEKLKKLGVKHVVNYRTDPNWGKTVKDLTSGGLGVDIVVELGGPTTTRQSLTAIKPEGVISIIGYLGGAEAEKTPNMLEALSHACIVRGSAVGSRLLFQDMNRTIEACEVPVVVDERVFAWEELQEAYQYMWDQKHFGKVVVRVAS
ncbi:uncharacterized protein Z518_03693 [Rhinocladiella mackenziei CBS 650.93]|uniref:Enoyl reductase (ER) domain-containing protein n=1 Tax=Rhinocladiella mackenziei CBS 650.93 TaxID=1442369 RepID=A0A0D2IRD4_9EURO|nr:uncharacterized protein Z518_03693 [Rhinocladiella mackenziei CBS 650.93]KIX05721.1 hypothetical protein Z518_03693 [Rhinocladiella mackenziei CBS 650.93]